MKLIDRKRPVLKDLQLNRKDFALFVVIPPERSKRFRREAEAAKLNHPNIGTIHALEEFDDVLLIIMEYVEGGTLSTHISSDGLTNAWPPAVVRAGQRDARFLYLH